MDSMFLVIPTAEPSFFRGGPTAELERQRVFDAAGDFIQRVAQYAGAAQ